MLKFFIMRVGEVSKPYAKLIRVGVCASGEKGKSFSNLCKLHRAKGLIFVTQ